MSCSVLEKRSGLHLTSDLAEWERSLLGVGGLEGAAVLHRSALDGSFRAARCCHVGRPEVLKKINKWLVRVY